LRQNGPKAAQIGPKRAKIGPRINVKPLFLRLFFLFGPISRQKQEKKGKQKKKTPGGAAPF